MKLLLALVILASVLACAVLAAPGKPYDPPTPYYLFTADPVKTLELIPHRRNVPWFYVDTQTPCAPGRLRTLEGCR